ncbi:uncharacterized protein AB675_4920 [Cyphellophora attinorum]|uniref:Uncharacterized protein n=1 Tax=Cyphellophora attinorum TaxID=1664694 RepID=A0A0N1H2K1_9EURO|nr:uncharacterized protein AB675_4920 [Phialophora attinorum]KPI34592.1 hypothetical protein AB675_4920 [Phialophora attinorum]
MADQLNAGSPPTTVLLLTHSRCASHVLEKMLSKQPNTVLTSAWFLPTRQLRRDVLKAGPINQVSPTLLSSFMTAFNSEYSHFLQSLSDAKANGKVAIAHPQPHMMLSPQVTSSYVYDNLTTHDPQFGQPGRFLAGGDSDEEPHTNPSLLPDSFFLIPGTIPIINFRHPMLLCEGVYRGVRDQPTFREANSEYFRKQVGNGASLYPVRLMYDWYVKHGPAAGISPILVEADDYLGEEKEALIGQICALIPGFDAQHVIYKWEKATAEEVSAMGEQRAQALQTINGSEGVMQGYDTQGKTIESETRRWREKYGDEDAEFIRALVDKAMPDYEYFRERRLRPDGAARLGE